MRKFVTFHGKWAEAVIFRVKEPPTKKFRPSTATSLSIKLRPSANATPRKGAAKGIESGSRSNRERKPAQKATATASRQNTTVVPRQKVTKVVDPLQRLDSQNFPGYPYVEIPRCPVGVCLFEFWF